MGQHPHPGDEAIRDELRAGVEGLIAAYRFGSSATPGLAHRGSDIDLAVLAREPLAPERRFDLQERLAALLKRDVDLVDLSRASPVMAVQVIGGGILLVDADPDARGRYEDRMLTAYARLNEERRAILERVRAEGTVYGR